MNDKIERYEPLENSIRQFIGMGKDEDGEWIREDDLLIIKDQLAEIISGMKYRSDNENKKLLRQIFNKI